MDDSRKICVAKSIPVFFRILPVILVPLFFVTGCGKTLDVQVDITETMNDNSAVAIDLLLVYDEKLMEKLSEMTADQWFDRKDQLKRDNLAQMEGEGVDVWEWEWVPGQEIPLLEVKAKWRVKGGMVFADYHSPGPHRFRFDPSEDIEIRLMEHDFIVEMKE